MVPRGTPRARCRAGVVHPHGDGVGLVEAVAVMDGFDLSGAGGVVEAVGAGLVGHVEGGGGVMAVVLSRALRKWEN